MKRLNLFAAALITAAVGACAALDNGPTEHDTAVAIEQDAETAAMQAAIDRNCAGLDQRSELQCALDTLQELQPDRWIPEDAARAALAVPFAATKTKE
ncbi:MULTISPECIES: hypothetical protein [Brachymonas]|uniref:hypothetical protein n=1 Tax=Brachymonas TaxID=28219 RepID=UPI002E778990|nr:hypothetical protein [Brachymonas sp. J145]MEE1653767.1 hypothetical protein [Brachymonas sp. J145]